MKNRFEICFPISILFAIAMSCSHTSIAQYRSIGIGGAVSPLHQSRQSDFAQEGLTYNVNASIRQGNLGLRVDHLWRSNYRKENFSFSTKDIELSIFYSLKSLFNMPRVNPYIRIGVAKWSTSFTTEGYPGIVDYELKVEKDSGFGAIASIGAQYLISNVAIGLEVDYSKRGSGQFIAGGFDPQPLALDEVRLKLTATYYFHLGARKSFSSVLCPNFKNN